MSKKYIHTCIYLTNKKSNLIVNFICYIIVFFFVYSIFSQINTKPNRKYFFFMPKFHKTKKKKIKMTSIYLKA